MFIIKNIMKHISNFTWLGIFVSVAIHMFLSYFGLFLIGESSLIENFFYFYGVTGSTVGYGDFSPVTTLGKYFVVLWIVPGGIAFFTAILGKVIGSIQGKVGKMKHGLGTFVHYKNHVVVIGYKQGETEKLFRETEQKLGKTEKIVVSTSEVCPHETWVKAETFTDMIAFERAGITTASRVVIMLDSDGETVSTIMSVMSKINAMKENEIRPIVIAFIQDENQAKLIRANFPSVECVVSNRVSYMARSMADPGISQIFESLTSSSKGHTLYCYVLKNSEYFTVNEFEEAYDCSVIATKKDFGDLDFVNNCDKTVYDQGSMVYYISEKRIQ